MKYISSTKELQRVRDNKSVSIGFVPTMGALHKGHLSLVEKAIKENDIVVVSIFVNPLQFNNKKDLHSYPVDLENDIKMLEGVGCDILFAPSYNEIYPEGNTFMEFDLAGLDKVMEGKYRSGHFDGVATVVYKLFECVKPNKAYFGEKDFQQLAVIKHLVRLTSLPIKIVACSTCREKDGLAMSSRNRRLNPQEREAAAAINKTLLEVKNRRISSPISELKKYVNDAIKNIPLLELEYFEIVDASSLNSITEIVSSIDMVACIAVNVGEVRLIDNIRFSI